MRPDHIERDIQFRNLSAEQREQLMIQVAKRYYHLDMTMSDLSTELGLTRWQASRLLT
jgi:deoxyribonucleoside regulator